MVFQRKTTIGEHGVGRRVGRNLYALGFFLAITVFAASVNAGAATYYVDRNNGSASDGNPGTIALPFLTIQHAANIIQAGDTVIVKPGVYPERITFASGNSGSAGNRVTFRAEPRRSVDMKGFNSTNCAYLTIEGFNITTKTFGFGGGGVWVDSDHIEVIDNFMDDIPTAGVQVNWSSSSDYGYIEGNYIYGCQYGITVSGNNWTVLNNEIERLRQHPERTNSDVDYIRFFGLNHVYRNNYLHGTIEAETGNAHLDGFQTWSLNSTTITRNIVIDGNFIQDNDQGVIMESVITGNVSDIFITNNVFDTSGAWGVSVSYGCTNIVVENNIFMNMATHSCGIRTNSSGTIRNNIVYNSDKMLFAIDSDVDLRNNLIFNIGDFYTENPLDINGLDPQFVNPNNLVGPDGVPFTADDGYLLQATSPAIDAGFSVSLTTDQIGTSRPQGSAMDIGPREFFNAGPAGVTVGIGTPSPAATANDSIDFVVSYGNADAVTLAASDVTVNTTGSATGTASVTGSGTASRTVTVSGVSGDGTVSISLAAGTASNGAGNAPVAGPSTTATVDNSAPVISIAGDDPLTWPHGVAYTDPGASATDAVDGNVTGDISVQSNVNTSIVGVYTVSYSVSDDLGNASSSSRTVHVTDQTAPVLTLNGANPMELTEGNSYSEPGATAVDAVDGDLTGAIGISGAVDTNTPGTYFVAYVVNDAAGNASNVTRAVEVVERDATPPTITILGANPATVQRDETYQDAGASAVDDVDGDVTGAIVVENNVNTSAIGTYDVVYRVSDAAGNQAVSSRVVEVVESNEPPVLDSIAAQNIDEAQTLSFTVSATDPQGTMPVLSATGLPSGATFTAGGNGTGQFEWTPDRKQGRKQPYSIVFTANDGELTDSASVSVTVKNINRGPKLNKPNGPKKGREKDALSVDVSASDEDDDPLVLTADLSTLPSGSDATFTDNGDGTAELTWTPQEGDAGTYQFTVVVTDVADPSMSDSAVFDIDIEPAVSGGITVHVAADAAPEFADGSESNPFVTIGAAIAVTEAGRGDVVQVHAGTYLEDVQLPENVSLVGVDGAYGTLLLGSSDTGANALELRDGSAVRGMTIAGKTNAASVKLDSDISARVSNCVLTGSSIGLYLWSGSHADVVNVTISNNTFFGILAASGASMPQMFNNVITGNKTAVSAPANSFGEQGYNVYFGNDTDLDGPVGSATDLAVDPRFVNAADLNFHLQSASLCRNAGHPDAEYDDQDASRNDLGADGGPQGVTDALAPLASFSASVSKLTVPATVLFNALGSSDEWGIAEYDWDFDAQDGLQVDAMGPQVQHTFETAGLYTVTLSVTDHNGLTASATQSFELGSGVPAVEASADPSAGPIPLFVALTGTATDPEGGPVSLFWDFDGDGVTDSSDANPEIEYPVGTLPGNYAVTLLAIDDENLSAQTTIPITVTEGPVAASVLAEPDAPVTLDVLDSGNVLFGASASLAAGALSDATVFCISTVDNLPAAPGGVIMVTAMSLDPSALVLSVPADVIIPLPDSKAGADTYDVVMYDRNSGQWTSDPISDVHFLDSTEQFIVCKTARLGIIGVVSIAKGSVPILQISPTTLDVVESEESITVVVSLDRELVAGETVTVHYAAASMSAQSGDDFEATSGTITLGPGKSSQSIVVPIRDDANAEPNEQFRIILSDVEGAELGPNSTVTVTIVDDDGDEVFDIPAAQGGCSAGMIDPGSTTPPPAEFLLFGLMVITCTFSRRLKRNWMHGFLAHSNRRMAM